MTKEKNLVARTDETNAEQDGLTLWVILEELSGLTPPQRYLGKSLLIILHKTLNLLFALLYPHCVTCERRNIVF